MTGDFNADAGGEVYKVFTGLKDAWLEAGKRSGPETTSCRWVGNTEGRRIDWIMYRGKLRATQVETVTYNKNGSYPSDHYPVFAIIE